MVVINKSIRNAVMPFVAISSLIALGSCKTEEVAPTAKFSDDLLIGDWLANEEAIYSYDDVDVYALFRFEANKDFFICASATYSSATYTYCDEDYELKWKWQDATNSTIVVTEPGEPDMTADVVLLNSTNMELDIAYDTGTETIKFIKVN